MSIALGQLEYGVYLEYTIWALMNGLPNALQVNPDWKTYTMNFDDEEDATAFKLKFEL